MMCTLLTTSVHCRRKRGVAYTQDPSTIEQCRSVVVPGLAIDKILNLMETPGR
jgi:hypothetical protein